MSDFEKSFDYYSSIAGLSQFANFLDEQMDATAVLRYLQEENSGFSGRKEFCEILGIGESTLSGWLKGDRIPKMAKLVIGLLKARDLDREALEQEEKRVEELKVRDRIVKDGDRYMIAEFASNDGIGRVVARDIPDEASARKLNSRYQYIDLLHEVRGQWPLFVAEDDEDDEYAGYVEFLLDQIEEALVTAGIKLKPLNSSEKFSFDADDGAAESEEANADA
jgi:transcriptional regulator with XRE-family HTH domain